MKHDVIIPAVGESISEVVLAKWLKEDGDFVEADELLCEIESDKASFEIPAEQSGTIKIISGEGDTVEVGGIIAQIDEDGAPESGKAVKPEKEDKTPLAGKEEKAAPAGLTDGQKERRIKISPVAANILAEAGLEAEAVSGSGAGGRITKEDAQRAVENLKKQGEEAPDPGKFKEAGPATIEALETEKPASEPSAERQTRRERLSTLRKTVSRRLVAAKNETAMLTTFNEIDMSAVIQLRSKYKEIFKEKYEVGLGFMSFFSKAVCIALKEWPAVNAQLDGDEVVYHDFCDISIAVSSPRGLVVPVIRNADRISLAEIELQVQDLATKARDNKLTIEEMSGGTFTISNGGVFGSLMSTPILNPPQTAVLGMHKIMERPVVIEGQIVIRPMMYVALSYDHRIIDGRESVSFLVRVKELLEDPARMLLEI
jgi:2-oxoglutarate dehydrogenase E2 component (dihydrolipoamide succinyltransferase)